MKKQLDNLIANIHNKLYDDALAIIQEHPLIVLSSLAQHHSDTCHDKVVHLLTSRGAEQVLAQALALGADPNARGLNGWTPLHSAAWHGGVRAMPILLDAGAEIEAANDFGDTPLDLTYNTHDPAEGFEYLLSRGAKPGLIPALEFDRLDLLADLARSPDRDAIRARAGDPTLLHYLAERGHHADFKMHILQMLDLYRADEVSTCSRVEMTRNALYNQEFDKALWNLDQDPQLAYAATRLDEEPDYDTAHPHGRSRLIHFVAGVPGAERVLRRMIALGADVRARGWKGVTALHWAAWQGNQAAMPILLDAGADIEATDDDGMTPLDLTYGPEDAVTGVPCLSHLLSRGAKPGLLPAMKYDQFNLFSELERAGWPTLRSRVPDLDMLWEFAEEGPAADAKVAFLTRLGVPRI